MRKTLSIILLAATSTAFAQAAVNSQRAQRFEAMLEKRFAAADANHDGKLTRDEVRGKMPFLYKNFDAIDSAKTGYVTLDQIRQFVAKRIAARRHGAARQ